MRVCCEKFVRACESQQRGCVGESGYYWESASESGWDHLRIFFEMRVKARERTCERARGESVVLKSACDSASESACE